MWERLDLRPLVVGIAGPNGAGKSTFYDNYVMRPDLRLVNADVIAARFGLSAYAAADVAGEVRESLFEAGISFAFETVLSDPVQAKIAFLEKCAQAGYHVVLFFIGIESADLSFERVSLRVLQQGHGVPEEKLRERFPRILENLRHAIIRLPLVVVFDNSDLNSPYRRIAIWENGAKTEENDSLPKWYQDVVQSLT